MYNFDSELQAKNGRIIHQVWYKGILNCIERNRLYKRLRTCRDSWRKHNSDWTIVEWNNEMGRDLIRKFYPQYLNLYDSYEYEIQRCDAVRYFILHRYGGWYADMDYLCCRPLDIVMEKYPKGLYIVESPDMGWDEGHNLSNSLMYSRPHHAFWEDLIRELNEISTPVYFTKHLKIISSTGPLFLNRVFRKYKYKYNLSYLPYDKFHPCGISADLINFRLSNKHQNIYMYHINMGSWESSDSKFTVAIYREWKLIAVIISLFLCLPFLENFSLLP